MKFGIFPDIKFVLMNLREGRTSFYELLSLFMTLWFFSVILLWLSDTVLAPQLNVTRITHLGKTVWGSTVY